MLQITIHPSLHVTFQRGGGGSTGEFFSSTAKQRGYSFVVRYARNYYVLSEDN